MDFRIRDILSIQKLIQENELWKAINQLAAISEIDELNEYRKEMYSIKARFQKNRRQNRIGVISKTDFDIEENRINSALIEIIEEIRMVEGIDAKIRLNYKEILFKIWYQSTSIEIDYSEISQNKIRTLEFKLD